MIFPQIPHGSALFCGIQHALWKLQIEGQLQNIYKMHQGALSSLLSAFHCVTSWRNTMHPCLNFCHHTSRQVLFCSFILPCMHSFFCHFSRQQREGKQVHAHSFCCMCTCAFIFPHSPSVEHCHVQRFLIHHVEQYQSRSNTTSASMLSVGGLPPVPNPIGGPPNNEAVGPIAAIEQCAATLLQCAHQAAVVARDAVAIAADINNAHAIIVAQHRKMFLARAFWHQS
jgi:hypothetical protein